MTENLVKKVMEFRGGKNQVGNSNRQFIESTVITNSNNNFTININVNCTDCHQHQHLEGVSSSQGNIHHVIDCLQKIATLQPCDPPAAEADMKCQIEPATQSQEEVVKYRIEKHRFSRQAVTDSVKIVDPDGQKVEPGDAIWAYDFFIYVGDGYVVSYDEDSKTVVKEKLDKTRPFRKAIAKSEGNLNEFLPKQRVQRALQQVGRPCPVQGGSGGDFVYWTYTGLSYEQNKGSGYTLCVQILWDTAVDPGLS